MIGISNLVAFVMSVATFFSTNFPVPSIFPSWSQRLLAGPTEVGRSEPSYVMDLPASITQTVTVVLGQITTMAMAPPNNAVAIIPMTMSSTRPSLLALVKEATHALYTLLFPLLSDAGTLISAFFFAALLLAFSIGFLNSSPTIMKPEDLGLIEAQLYAKDTLIEEMLTTHNAAIAALNQRLQLQIQETGAASLQHDCAMGEKEQEIKILRRDLEYAWHMELMAKYRSTDKVFKLEQEIGHLRAEIENLDDKLEAAGDTIAAAEVANEKVQAANERAHVATQEAQEAHQKVTAAEKACEAKVEAAIKANMEKITAERQNAQAAIYKLLAEINTQKNKVRVEEYKVQDLKRENKELAAKARVVADVPSLPSFVVRFSAQAAEETRRRLRELPGQELPRLSASAPAVAWPAATVEPKATAAVAAAVVQTKGHRTVWKAAAMPNPVQLVCRRVKGPFDR